MVGLWQLTASKSALRGHRGERISRIWWQKIHLESSGETLLKTFLLLQWERSWPGTQLLPVPLAEKMMVTIQKHKVVNIPSENTLYSWKAIKRTIKKPTQPIPKHTSLPKHRLEFPRFVITPCSPEPLLTLGKILVGISQPQPLPCIQAQEFGLGLMKRRREILPHWRERSKSVLPQVHSPGGWGSDLHVSPVMVAANLQSWGWRGAPAVKFSSMLCMEPSHPFPVLGSSWTFSVGQCWGPSDLHVGHPEGLQKWLPTASSLSLVWLLFILSKSLFKFEHD